MEKFLFCQKDCSEIIGIEPQNFLRLGATLKREEGREKFYDIREVYKLHVKKKNLT